MRYKWRNQERERERERRIEGWKVEEDEVLYVIRSKVNIDIHGDFHKDEMTCLLHLQKQHFQIIALSSLKKRDKKLSPVKEHITLSFYSEILTDRKNNNINSSTQVDVYLWMERVPADTQSYVFE